MASSVAVAGSKNSNSFAVIDFTNSASPVNVPATPPFAGGCTVDCYGALACAGNYVGGQIAIYDISKPASPTWKGSVTTILNGIGAISFDGSHVLAGELNGWRLVFL